MKGQLIGVHTTCRKACDRLSLQALSTGMAIVRSSPRVVNEEQADSMQRGNVVYAGFQVLLLLDRYEMLLACQSPTQQQ